MNQPESNGAEPDRGDKAQISPADRAADFARRDALVTAGAGAMPSPTEEAAADRAAEEIDLDEVGKNEREMLDIGAHVKGEGNVP